MALSPATHVGPYEIVASLGAGGRHLLAKRDNCAGARAVLQPVVGTITEGRDTLDYVAADALLQTLG